jgi:DNA-binding phage protein
MDKDIKNKTTEEIIEENTQEFKRKKKSIQAYYKKRLVDNDSTLIEIMCETVDKFEIDEYDLAEIIKEDETMYKALENECGNKNMFKVNKKHAEISDVFK